MLEQLFGSKTRVKLLKTFFSKPEGSFFVRELSRAIEVQINAVRRELELLLGMGLLQEEKRQEDSKEADTASGSSLRKYYRLNPSSIIYNELQALLIKERLVGEEEFMRELQKKAGAIKLLILSGTFTGDKRSPTDILIVGAVKEHSLARLVQAYEKEFGFPIRYTSMGEQEFNDRRYVMDKFIYSVFEASHLKVVNELGL